MTEKKQEEQQELSLSKFSTFEAEIANLKQAHSLALSTVIKDDVTFQVVDNARKSVKQVRTSIEKTRKILKEDSLRYGKMVDSKAKELSSLVEEIENSLIAKIDTFNAEVEAVKEQVRRKNLIPERRDLMALYKIEKTDDELMQLDDDQFREIVTAKRDQIKQQLRQDREIRLEKYMSVLDRQIVFKGRNIEEIEQVEFDQIIEKLQVSLTKKQEEEEAEKARKFELERQNKLQNERMLIIAPLSSYGEKIDLSILYTYSQEQFDKIVSDKTEAKKVHDAEQEVLKAEKEKLRLQQEELEKARKEAEAERVKQELELAKLKAAENARIAKEKADKEKQEAEAKKLAELPLKQQMEKYIDSINPSMERPFGLTAELENAMNNISSKFTAWKKWAKMEIEKA